MYPEIGLVRTYRRSDSLSTRLDDPNILTRKYENMNNTPRDPLLVPVTRSSMSTSYKVNMI